ncbi:MAG: hypothetical protein LUE16_09945 [Lachnospiraceae bacterium]|nr:hypothetical protein [Lachnospiraceae bacterium]
MLDMMLSGQYRYSLNAGNEVQYGGVRLATILLTVQDSGSSSDFTESGMYDMEPINLGIALMFAVIVFFLLRGQRKKTDIHWDRVGLTAFAVGAAAVFASTSYFPWDNLDNVNDALNMLGSMIQFPTRLTTISTVCMVTVACVAAKWVMESGEQIQRSIFLAVLCGLCVFFAMNQLNDRLYSTDDFLRIYSAKAMGHSNILGGEYLPLGVEQGFTYHDAVVPESGNVTVTSYSKENLDTYTTLEVSEDGGG